MKLVFIFNPVSFIIWIAPLKAATASYSVAPLGNAKCLGQIFYGCCFLITILGSSVKTLIDTRFLPLIDNSDKI